MKSYSPFEDVRNDDWGICADWVVVSLQRDLEEYR